MLLEAPEIERLIVETHATVATLVERSHRIDDKLSGVLTRQDKTNGSVAAIQAEQYKQEGALSAMKWLFAALMTITGLGVGVAGMVLALVAKGG